MFIFNYNKVYRVSVLVALVGNGFIRILFGFFILAYVGGIVRKIQATIFIIITCLSTLAFVYLRHFKTKETITICKLFRNDPETYMGDELKDKLKHISGNLAPIIFFCTQLTILPYLVDDAVTSEANENTVVNEKWIFRTPVLNVSEIDHCRQSAGELCTYIGSFQRSPTYKIVVIISSMISGSVFPLCTISLVFAVDLLRAKVALFVEHLQRTENEMERIVATSTSWEETSNRTARQQLLRYDAYVDEGFRILYTELQDIRK